MEAFEALEQLRQAIVRDGVESFQIQAFERQARQMHQALVSEIRTARQAQCFQVGQSADVHQGLLVERAVAHVDVCEVRQLLQDGKVIDVWTVAERQVLQACHAREGL